MRPRVFPAEDTLIDELGNEVVIASMRPRVFPAEDMKDRTDVFERLLLQ